MRPRRSGGRDVPAFGRALGAPFAPHAPFADVGAECEIVAHQELVDGRLLVRCRAKRHVRLLDAREDPGGAGYLVARVEPVVDDEGEARDERIRATREFAATRVPPDASAPDASRTSTPLTARVAARAGLQRDSIGPRVADQRDWATTALLGERATAMHQTWLARVAGRPAAPGFSGAASSRSASLFRPNFLRRSYRDDVDNLLGWCGARPRADRLDDLSWWLTRVATPHPPIGAAVELRGECLAATSAKARFRVIHEKLVESMREVHRMRPSQWRGARPLASVNVAMATLRALEGRDGWRAAARECAFGDGEGYRDGDRNDRGVPRGNDYARVLEETLGALQKHAPTSLLLSDASDAANGAPPALSRPHVYPATPRTGGGAIPRGPIGASSSVSIDTSRLETSWDDSPESRDPETTSRLLLGTIERGAFPGLCWALYRARTRRRRRARRTHPSTGRRAQSLRREKTPRRVSSTGRRRGRDSRVRWGRRRVPRRRREERRRSILRRRRRSSRRRESRVAAVGVGGVGADRLTRVTVRRVGRGGGGASRGADDRQGRVRHRGGGGALRRAQLRVTGESDASRGGFADASRGRRIGGGRNRTVRDFAGCDRVSIFIDRSRSRSRRGNRRRRRRSRRSSLESRAPSVFVCAGAAGGSPALLRLDLRRHL